jgi:RimJ/RimL family protein N-acetyltransferase
VSRIPELSEPLHDGRVTLRFAAERDIPELLIAHQDDPALHRRLGLGRPPSGAELGREFDESASARAAGRQVVFTILEAGSDDCVGQLRARAFDWDHARAELDLWLAPQARGRGLSRGALGLGSRWLFDVCGMQRIELLAAPDDEPGLRAAAAAGFHREGVLRAHTRDPGAVPGRADRIVLSLLPGDLRPAERPVGDSLSGELPRSP